MNRSKANFRIYNGKTLKILSDNIKPIILSLIFASGVISGASSINQQTELSVKINEYINNHILYKSGQGITDIFLNSLTSNSIFLILNIFLSFSLLGYALIIWLPFLKGLGVGTVSGFLYSSYGITGFGYSLLTIFPGVIISTFALIIACNAGCEYSKNAYAKAITGKGQFEKGETKFFLLKQMIYLCICIISSLIDTAFSVVFLKFFEF